MTDIRFLSFHTGEYSKIKEARFVYGTIANMTVLKLELFTEDGPVIKFEFPDAKKIK